MGMVGLEPARLAAHDPKSCSSANFDTSPKSKHGIIPFRYVAYTVVMRLWVERVMIGVLSFAAIATPLIMGLLTFLAFSDGITMGAGDPTREARLWMVKDNRNFGVAYTTPVVDSPGAASPANTCVRNNFYFLRLRGGLRIEHTADYCTCYVLQAGKWIQSPATCA